MHVFGWQTGTSLLPFRDWLDQLTTHAYTAAPDIVLCGNKVILNQNNATFNQNKVFPQTCPMPLSYLGCSNILCTNKRPKIIYGPYLDLYDKCHDSQMPKYCISHDNILKLEHLHCIFLFQVDLEGLRTVSSDRGRAMAAELGLPYFETSAATGQGDLLQISYSHSVLVFIKHET